MVNGKSAIVQAVLDSHAEHVVGVPGYPITDIMESLAQKGLSARWCVNEKVAFESCIGASCVGRRSLLVTKHVGVNILADPLVTSATHTLGAGVVIIAGDDPGAKKSQNEQDSRYYGLLAEIIVFDPSTPQDAYDSVVQGYRLSEKTHAPVIVRITNRLNRLEGEIRRIRYPEKPPETPVFDHDIWKYTLEGKHHLFHKTSYPAMREYVEKTTLNRVELRESDVGLIASGYPLHMCKEIAEERGYSLLSLNVVNPLPARIAEEFLRAHERVLVIEETEPFVEHQLGGRVLGKLTGHLPFGRINREHILQALDKLREDTVEADIQPERIETRGYMLHPCSQCPFTPLYDALDEFDFPVAGDVGCSILMAPSGSVDVAVSLGSAIGVALGFKGKGVAVIGDFGLAHSGLQSIIDAVDTEADLLVLVIQNHIAAMTGGQPAVDLRKAVSCMVEDVTAIDAETADRQAYSRLIREKIAKKGISVVFVEGKCPEGAVFQKIKI
jgi:indolepyruvate ferredoxin oxidoreductase alpha subunit